MTFMDRAERTADERAPTPGLAAGELGWEIGVLGRAYLVVAARVTADLPGQVRGYQVLSALGRLEAPTQAELAAHLGVDRTVMTYLLDDLEAAGLVGRRLDPTDRRVRRLGLTAEGTGAVVRLAGQLVAAESEVLPGLDAADREALRTLLHRVGATLTGDPDTWRRLASQALPEV